MRAVETLLEGLAATWEVLSGIVVLFVGLWVASKPSRWLEQRKKRREGPTETVFLDDKTLQELDAGAKSRAQASERRHE